MMLRQPTDQDLYWTYWRLGLEDSTEALRWLKRHEFELSFWEDMAMPFPGFYRDRKERMPIAFWIADVLDDAGEAIDQPYLVMKTGVWKPVTALTAVHHEISFFMTWAKCYRDPVSEEAYRWALQTYKERSVYEWADDPPPPAPKPAPVDLAKAPSVF